MDPLESLCSIPPRHVLSSPLENPRITYRASQKKKLDIVRGKMSDLRKIYGDEVLMGQMHTTRKELMHLDEDKYLKKVYSLEELSNCNLVNRCGNKLANLDYHFELTGPRPDLLSPQIPGYFSFCDIAAGPGGFSDYIFWRRPEAEGYGITYRKLIEFHPKMLIKNFHPVYGKDGTGNLMTSWKDFRDEVLYQHKDGVDLIICDAGFSREEALVEREFSGIPLILIEVYLSIRLAKPGGHCVVKLHETLTETMGGIVYLLAQHFESISLFKPATSRSHSLEIYLIGKNRNTEKLSPEIETLIASKELPIKMFDLPEDFKAWLRSSNDFRMTNIMAYLENFKRAQKGEVVPRIDLHKFSLYLNLPPENFYQKLPKESLK
jgi:23S rRNA U2552 (ribose-2'-O)-methylase RlmE/FtsJ